MGENGSRKIRSDKKRAIAAPLDQGMMDQIAQISYICDLPLKSVGEILCRDGYRSLKMVDALKGYFRRDLAYSENHILFGDRNRPAYKPPAGEKKRLYMRFYDFEHERFSALSFALDCSVQSAAALLIQTALQRKDIMYPVLAKYIQREMDTKRREQLRSLCRFLDYRSPEEHITVPMVLAHALDKSVVSNTKIKKTINEWIDN